MTGCMYCPCPVYQGRRCRGCFDENNTESVHSVTRCEVCEEIMCVHTLPRTVCESCEGCMDYDTDTEEGYAYNDTPPPLNYPTNKNSIIKCVANEDHVERECMICLSGLKVGEPLGQLRCHHQHTFHIECISEWHRKSSTCPLCRK